MEMRNKMYESEWTNPETEVNTVYKTLGTALTQLKCQIFLVDGMPNNTTVSSHKWCPHSIIEYYVSKEVFE